MRGGGMPLCCKQLGRVAWGGGRGEWGRGSAGGRRTAAGKGGGAEVAGGPLLGKRWGHYERVLPQQLPGRGAKVALT